jgi:hypothetical protein
MTRKEIVPELKRIRAEHIDATRIIATPAALDAAIWPRGALAMRIAPDEALVITEARHEIARDIVKDPHAIVERDAGFAGAWVAADEALAFRERACEWELPRERPAFAQGAVADLPMKLWLEEDRVLLIVPAPYATDLEERLE